MTKIFKLLMAAIFASLTLSLTACGGDDDDEPDFSGGNNSGNYTFTANGQTFYYGIPLGVMDLVQIGTCDIDHDDYYTLSVCGYDRQLTAEEGYNPSQSLKDKPCRSIDLFITVNPFNLSSAKSGDPIAIHRTQTSQGYDVVSPLEYWDVNNYDFYFYWGQTPQGQISFVSYKDDVLTVNFKNCIFVPVLDFNDIDDLKAANVPEKFTINGNVSFDVRP